MLPLKPGKAAVKSGVAGFEAGVQQSQNPKTESTQKIKRTTESNGVKTTEEVETKIGAAQKDTAREAAAKLAALRPTMYIGILVFLFGAASLFWPPLKVIVGSVTTSAVVAGAGLALIVLPSLIVGNEVLILGVALGGAALYWFSHRHGKLRGAVETLTGK